ncbi:hypothetical protein [Nostoc sp. CCY0012]|uniref:hypothetical protein n=1 Tax=Nostoc sp. CCY0012 TaxID=1056123 RepID=UPI0039C6178D
MATILFIPGALLFGVVLGSVYVFMAATFVFLIGHYLCRDVICRMIQGNVKFKAIDKAVAQEGFKIVLYLAHIAKKAVNTTI